MTLITSDLLMDCCKVFVLHDFPYLYIGFYSLLSVLCRQHVSSGPQSKGLAWLLLWQCPEGVSQGCWLEQEAHLWRQPHAVVPVHVCASQPCHQCSAGPWMAPQQALSIIWQGGASHGASLNGCSPQDLTGLPSPDSPGTAAAAFCCCGAPLSAPRHVYLRCKCGLLKNCFVCGPLNKRKTHGDFSVSWSCSAAAVVSTFQVLCVVLP